MIAPLKEVENSVFDLSNLRLDSSNSIEQYTDRKDEIGNIANAVSMLCISLKNVTEDIGRILGEMADENFAVAHEEIEVLDASSNKGTVSDVNSNIDEDSHIIDNSISAKASLLL